MGFIQVKATHFVRALFQGLAMGAGFLFFLPGIHGGARADTVMVFNEIMYHPATNEAAMEWVEFHNQMAVAVDISNWQVNGDIDFTFPPGTRIAGRGFLVLARNPAALQLATGLASNVFGPFLSPLDNNGGTLELRNNSGRLMDRVKFGTHDDWPVTPDGAGPSLAKLDRDLSAGDPASWGASRQVGGTPGADNFPTSTVPVKVGFNEVTGTTNALFRVELMNYGSNAVALANCVLHHDGATNVNYIFPPGTTLPAGGFLTLSNSVLGFIAPAPGEKLFLFAPGQTNVYDGLVLERESRARRPEGNGAWFIPDVPTFGASNSFNFRSEIVINEIMYHHRDVPGADGLPLTASPEAWIELFNQSSNTVDLAGWELDGGVSFHFGTSTVLSPGGYLVVAADAAQLRALYPASNILGDLGGKLSGRTDRIRLRDAVGNPADEVTYFDGGHWPEYADGGGCSLELRHPGADNSRAEAWAASNESGKAAWQTYTYRMVAGVPAGSGQPTQWNDFVLGLLDEGECLVDDISVIEAPATAPVQFISNGNFENGLAGWRVLGTHGRSRIETDPDAPANHVLRVVASGPQEHMHNHIEATYQSGRSVVNGREYEISFRARWVAGNNLLNTRLYFNRCARTTPLPVPALNGTPGAANSRLEANIGPTFSQLGHTPVIPPAGSNVTVTVRVEDPQGVASCRLLWSVNGGAWSSNLMSSAGGVYSAVIPGAVAGNIVQFYLRAVDGLGAVSTFPARGGDSGALYKVNDGQADFTKGRNLRIILAPSRRDLLHASTNVMSNELLPATVIYDESRAYYDVGVHLKGSERGRTEDDRLGFHLKFQPDELFRGVHPVLLLDRLSDEEEEEDEQQEILIRHLLVNAGGIPGVYCDLGRVIAPRSAHSSSMIAAPRVEDEFIETAFDDGGKGTLWDYDLVYYPTTANSGGYKLPEPDTTIATDFRDLGNDREIYRYNFMIKNHRAADDYSRFIAMARAWSLAAGAQLDEQTRQLMDLDEWMRGYALLTLCGVEDTYTFGSSHNWMCYLRPADQKILYFPWDMDYAFARSATDVIVGNSPSGLNLNKIVTRPANLRRVYAQLQNLIGSTFNTNYMNFWITHYNSLVPGQNFSGVSSYIANRGAYVLGQIAAAGGNAAFKVTGSNVINTAGNLVTLSGTAPVSAAVLTVNGREYPVTWTSLTNWSVAIPLGAASNLLQILAWDVQGMALINFSTNVTAYYSGTPADPASVVINEILYAPQTNGAGYVELYNTATNFSFDLSGWRLDGAGYTFPPGSLITNGQYLTLAADLDSYLAANGVSAPVPFAEFGGRLEENGETLTLFRPGTVSGGEIVVDRVRYERRAPWPVITNGASLQLVDARQDNSRVANWLASTNRTPGRTNSVMATLPPFPPVWLNEVQVGNVTGPVDNFSQRDPWVEVFNQGTNALSLAGWFLTDTYTNLTQWALPTNVSVPAGGFTLVWCDAQTNQSVANVPHAAFRLTNGFGQLALTRITNGGPQIVDYLTYTNLSSNWSYGDFPDGQPFFREHLFVPTPAASNTNTAPAITVFINEWLADNLATLADPADSQFEDWFELYNPGTNTVNLGGYFLTDNLANKFQFQIPTNGFYTIPPGGHLLVWADDEPGQNATNRADLHVSFALAKGGEAIGLFAADGTAIDAVTFGAQTVDVSQGRFPDGAATLFFMPTRTPRTANLIPNTAPVLPVISNRFVHFGQPVSFTVPAIDVEGAVQTLTFSLTNSPAGANIGAASGLFSWVATNTLVPGTNWFTVQVTDSGAPPAGDAETFAILVRPALQFSLGTTGGGLVQFSFNTLPGQSYRLEYKQQLEEAIWTPLGLPIAGDGNPFQVTENSGSVTQRFYRVVALP